MNETNTSNGRHPQFEHRAVQLASEFGTCVETFECLPPEFQEFFEIIGYTRVCSLLVISDLQKGRSERQLSIKYGLTRDQIRGIKSNSRLCRRRSE